MASAQTSSAGNAASPPASAGATTAHGAGHTGDARHSGTARHTGPSRHAHAGKHARTASTKAAETPYRAALKQCVQGPASQRDSCIDQAVSQYGHS
jgi:hypothetical protein